MKRETAYDRLEEMSEIEGGAFSDVADQIEASSSSLQTYHAVLGFLPKPFEAKPRNMPISSLLKLYSSKRSGRKTEARTQLQTRFAYLDYSLQKKILWLFLDGAQVDRKFCYKHLKFTWDAVFETKLIGLWERHHEQECAQLLVQYGNIDYLRSHLQEFVQAADYYSVARRIGREGRHFVIDCARAGGLDRYVRLLYETGRSIGMAEAKDILWRAIHYSLLHRICCWGGIARYFRLYNGTTDWDGNPIEMIVPSIAWNGLVMDCMRYIYRIAPKNVVAEAIQWDMRVRHLYRELRGGRCYTNSDDGLIEKLDDYKVFCRLAYAMFPKDRQRTVRDMESLMPDWEHDTSHAYEYFDRRNWIDYADLAIKDLLATIQKFHLTEKMNADEWKEIYIKNALPKEDTFISLVEHLNLQPVCPTKDDFIKELLYTFPEKTSVGDCPF